MLFNFEKGSTDDESCTVFSTLLCTHFRTRDVCVQKLQKLAANDRNMTSTCTGTCVGHI